MDWLLAALGSTTTFAVVSVVDKIILMRCAPSARTFIVLTGLLQLPAVLIALLIVPLQYHSPHLWLIAVASGFMTGVSLIVMFWVLSRGEVSRVTSVYLTSPVFVAILAVIFLSETLSPIHWSAICVTITGAILISVQQTGGAKYLVLHRSFLWLLLAAILSAGGQFLSKIAVEDMEFWNLFAVRTVALAAACVILPFRTSVLAETRRMLSDRVGTGVFVLNEAAIAFVAVFLMLLAISLGPVSLVATVMSARPLIVLVIAVALKGRMSGILDEVLDRKILIQKAISAAMIVGGICTISML